MSANDTQAIKNEVRGYLVIFACLLTLSFTAVGLSYMHLPLAFAVFLTLLIAGIQVFLAAGYFMHLVSEKRVILYLVLALTAVFAVAVLSLPMIEHHDPITGTVNHNVS